ELGSSPACAAHLDELEPSCPLRVTRARGKAKASGGQIRNFGGVQGCSRVQPSRLTLACARARAEQRDETLHPFAPRDTFCTPSAIRSPLAKPNPSPAVHAAADALLGLPLEAVAQAVIEICCRDAEPAVIVGPAPIGPVERGPRRPCIGREHALLGHE